MQLALSDFELFQNQQLTSKNLHAAHKDDDDDDDFCDNDDGCELQLFESDGDEQDFNSKLDATLFGLFQTAQQLLPGKSWATTVSEEKWKFSCTTKCQFHEVSKSSGEVFSFFLSPI